MAISGRKGFGLHLKVGDDSQVSVLVAIAPHFLHINATIVGTHPNTSRQSMRKYSTRLFTLTPRAFVICHDYVGVRED